MTITRKWHAHEGRTLRGVVRQKRPGILELRVELPDGSRLHVPAAWTDMAGVAPTSTDVAVSTGIGRLIYYRAVRRQGAGEGAHHAHRAPPLLAYRVGSKTWSEAKKGTDQDARRTARMVAAVLSEELVARGWMPPGQKLRVKRDWASSFEIPENLLRN